MTRPTPTPAEVADEIEQALAPPEPFAWAATKYYGVVSVVQANRALIVRALRALGEPDDAAVERAAKAACELHGVPGRWTRLHEPDRRYWRDIARAALTARAE